MLYHPFPVIYRSLIPLAISGKRDCSNKEYSSLSQTNVALARRPNTAFTQSLSASPDDTAKSVSSLHQTPHHLYRMKTKPSTSRRQSDAYHPYPPPQSPHSHSFAAPDLPHRSASAASNGENPEQQYKVARAISSCTRCRQRKQKCDGKLPACTACERARVECIGFDAISKTNISRK